ncbi:U3 small nucleolar RNA-associated protein 8 [Diutina catenulata]
MASVGPGLSESYPLATLPRVSDVELEDRVVVAPMASPDSNTIDFGISKSIISSYLIKPTPKLLWSYALSPSTVVDAMETTTTQDAKVYAVGVTDKKKHRLLIISRPDSDPTAHETVEVPLTARIHQIKFYKEGLYVIFSTGTISVFRRSESGSWDKDESQGIKNRRQVRWSDFITFNGQDLVVLVFQTVKQVTYQLVAVEPSRIYEVETKTRSTSDKFEWCYSSGYLYQLNVTGQEIERLDIARFETEKKISVAPLMEAAGGDDNSENTNTVAKIYAACADRLVLSYQASLFIINFKYGAVLAQQVCKSSRSYPHPDQVVLRAVIPIKGLPRNCRTLAVYVNLKPKDNNVDINLVTADVGTSRLSECLGKAISVYKRPAERAFVGVSSVLDPDFVADAAAGGAELNEVFEALEKCAAARDVYKWERILIPYMKKEPWPSIAASIKKTKAPKHAKEYTFQEMDEDTDRIVDVAFITRVVALILRHNEDGQVESVDPDFFPEYTLMYLLTSPLFPVAYTTGLLQLFFVSGNITLLRQAVNTCPNLTVRELLIQLNNEVPDEVFGDLIQRLCTDFSMAEITNTFKELAVDYAAQINLDKLLVRLFSVPKNRYALYLLEVLIDVGGLFNWSDETVDTLNEFVERKVVALMANSFNLTLTNQVLAAAEPPKPKRGRKAKKPVPTGQLSQMDALLSMNHSAQKMSPIELSKKVPVYSVEKLAI